MEELPSSSSLIEVRHLHKTYGGAQPLHVLKGIDLTVAKGEMLAIMGASGSGKSTLLNVLGLLDGYDEGSYYFGGKLMRNLSEKEAARFRNADLGFIFQSFNLIHYKTALENVALPLFYAGVGYRERMRRAELLLDKVGLLSWKQHKPSELSGGQKQRVAIARALINNPKLILADEPTGALDSQTTDEVMALLQQINGEGATLIVITHEQSIADACHRTVHISDGVLV